MKMGARFLFVIALLMAAGAARAEVVYSTTPLDAFRFGSYVATGGLTSSTTAYAAELTSAQAHHIGIVRMNFDGWANIEPSSGTFNYAQTDQFVNIATDTFGMDFMITLPISVSWAPISGACPFINPLGQQIGRTHCPVTDPALIYRLSKNLATRYCNPSKIYFEAWNEPDNPGFWKGELLPRATDYITASLVPSYNGVKDGCPGATVIMGGLAAPRGTPISGATTTYQGGTYFTEFLLNGATNYMDTVNIHVYEDFMAADMITDITTITIQMANRGVSKPMWVTETSTTGSGTYASTDAAHEEWRKQQWFSYAYPVAYALSVQRVFWHTWHGPPGADDFAATYPDLTDRPVARTMLRNFLELQNSLPVANVSSGTLTALQFVNVTTARRPWVMLTFPSNPAAAIGGRLGTAPHRVKFLDMQGGLLYTYDDDFNSVVISSAPVIGTPWPAAFEMRRR